MNEEKDEELVYNERPEFPTNFKIREVTCPHCKISVKTNLAGPLCAKCKCPMITEIRPK